MKPIYLEFCGINSFSEKAEIDFRALLSGGVFGIFGDTGSGKSTILDCILLALYGTMERGARMSDVINYGSDSAYVTFDFEITTGGVRHAYRVRRERKRKNNSAKAFLYEHTETGENALAEGWEEVDVAVKKIIGVDFNDFKTCIALPQGDFAALVKAKPGERVELIARLFDLEKYGDRLSKSVNEQYTALENAVNLLRAEMEQNEGGRAEFIEAKEKEIAETRTLLIQAETILAQAEASCEKTSALFREKTQYAETCRKLSEMQLRYASMDAKRKAAERLPAAKLVADKAKAAKKKAVEKAESKARAEQAEIRRKRAETDLSERKKRLEEGRFDETISEYSVQLEKVRGARSQREVVKKLEEQLRGYQKQFKELKAKRVEENFSERKIALESELAALGEDDSLLGYLQRNLKDVLLADVYGEICADLRALQTKYPATADDVAALLQKYVLSENRSDDTIDAEKLTLAFKETERKRKALKSELDALEKRRLVYEDLTAKMENVQSQGLAYRALFDAASEQIAFLKDMDDEEGLERKLRLARSSKEDAQKSVDEAQRNVQTCHAETEKQNGLFALHAEQERFLAEDLQKALRDGGFATSEEAYALLAEIGDECAFKAECETFFKDYDFYTAKKAETDETKFSDVDEEVVRRSDEEKRVAKERKDGLLRGLSAAETELKQLLAQREKYQAYEKELQGKEKQKKLCEELRALLGGKKFLKFIASEYLQEICVAASKTLLSLTNSRYFLRYDEEFKVGDNLDGGNLRTVKTLSGGETFLVSLALALSLGNAICQKSLRPIEFFFLDEGFGTLDEKLVDTVMDVLGKLSKDFSVGLISHVEELKHRIDNKILVTGATETHGSRVRIERI